MTVHFILAQILRVTTPDMRKAFVGLGPMPSMMSFVSFLPTVRRYRVDREVAGAVNLYGSAAEARVVQAKSAVAWSKAPYYSRLGGVCHVGLACFVEDLDLGNCSQGCNDELVFYRGRYQVEVSVDRPRGAARLPLLLRLGRLVDGRIQKAG
jgi:hypothetical protein